MIKNVVILFILFLHSDIVRTSEQIPKREIRAVWLTSNYALDWPKTPYKTVKDVYKQKEELSNILNYLKKANFNMIFFQTRFGGNVIYNSKIEQVSPVIKDVHCKKIYDPLEFAIKECHRLGLECHAWLVTYNLGLAKNKLNMYRLLVNKKNKLKLKIYNNCGVIYLDPGEPSSSKYIISIVKEIVEKYDVDGIHMDYIRYPEHADKFQDNATYMCYSRGKDKNTWRKDNINHFVSELYDVVKKKKYWVQVSSAVIGAYTRIEHISKKYLIACEVYQDPEQWMRTGKHDFIVPMMYYSNDLFFQFIKDWKTRTHGRFVVPGLGVYRIDGGKNNLSPLTITEQILYSRKNNMSGNVFFRTNYLVNNTNGIMDKISNNFYTRPALLPPLVWLKKVCPAPPTNLSLTVIDGFILLSWDSVNSFGKEDVFYNVYQLKNEKEGIDDARNLISTRVIDHAIFIPIDSLNISGCYYAVTSYDRYHNESKMSKLVNFHM